MELNPLESAYSPVSDWLKSLPWWASIVGFAAYAAVLFILQALLFRLLKRWAVKSQKPWLTLGVSALQRSILLFLISGMVGAAPVIFRMPKDWKKIIGISAELIAILAFAVFFQKLLLAAYRRYVARDEEHRTHSGLIRVLITFAVYSIFFMIFLDTAGISITPLIASLGVGSVAVAFALQETLASLFAGLYLIADKPIRLGDYVKLDTGEEGYVESIGWRCARIRMLPNNIVIVPNSKLARGVITNYCLPSREIVMPVEVSVDYGSDLEKVERVTVEVAKDVMKTVHGGVPEFEPVALFHGLGDSGIQMTVKLRVAEFFDQYFVKHEFIKKLHQRYRKEGIVIPFPIRTVLMKKD